MIIKLSPIGFSIYIYTKPYNTLSFDNHFHSPCHGQSVVNRKKVEGYVEVNNSDKLNIAMSWADFKTLLIHMDDEPDTVHDILKPIIEEKAQKILRRKYYTLSKTARTEAEREQARQQYLDEIGVPQDSRW